MNKHSSFSSLGEFDLVVAGGGAAGAAAAITAARLGLSTLLIEPLSFLGGTGVASQVTPWMPNNIEMGPLNEGLNAEFQRDLEELGEAVDYSINPESLKVLLERKAIEAGVQVLFEATVVDIEFADNVDGELPRVNGLLVATRHGLHRVSAKTVVDATGDAHLAHMAGVPCREGREADGVHQPMSLRFVMGEIDIPRLKQFFDESAPDSTVAHRGLMGNGPGAMFIKEFAVAAKWPQKWIDTFSIQFFQIPGRPRELWFNCPRITGYDPLDPLSLSAAYIEGRRMIEAYVKLFRTYIAGAEKAYLVMTAPLMGIREGRRIVGQYSLTGDDFFERRKFDDGICFNRYPIDIHNPHGQGVTWIEMEPEDWHEIPFRCLVPQGVRGMLVAGRCISGDFSAQASFRIIPNCRTMGEAAGLAAWLAREDGCDVSEVDGARVRGEMLDRGLLPRLAVKETVGAG